MKDKLICDKEDCENEAHWLVKIYMDSNRMKAFKICKDCAVKYYGKKVENHERVTVELTRL